MCSLIVSKQTEDRVKLAKKYIQDKYQALISQERQKKENWKKIVQLMTKTKMPDTDKQAIQKELKTQQGIKKRLMRQKDSLKNYQLYNLIGKGAFGQVRLARNINSEDEIVAIKRMEKKKLVEKKQISSAYMEKQLMIKNNDSKFLVKLHSTFQDRNYLYLVMEYVSGGDLLHLLIEKDIFTEDQTRFYIAQLIAALEEIHSRNFIHRDIKPDNILIDSNGHIKISDFGLSKHMAHDAIEKEKLHIQKSSTNKKTRKSYKSFKKQHENIKKINFLQERTTKTFSKVGTPDYISPEVLTAEQYDYSIDIWSVGVIMFQCLFGYPPFSDDDPKIVCHKVINWIQNLEFPENYNVSIQAKLLVLGMINERQNRLSIKQIKEHPFFYGFDWKNIFQYKPPMIPKLQHQLDTKNFQQFQSDTEWTDEDESENCEETIDNQNQFQTEFESFKRNTFKKRSSSADYLFAGFQYKNVPIEPFKLIENKIQSYQKEKCRNSVKKLQVKKSPEVPKKSIKRLFTEQSNDEKNPLKIAFKNISEKYIVNMPKSAQKRMSNFNKTTSSLLQSTKNNSKIMRELSFSKEIAKSTMPKSLQFNSIRRIPSSSKIGSKKII